MKMKTASHKIIRILFAVIVGVFVTAFASGVMTVRAAENETIITIEEEGVGLEASADNAGSSVFLLLGGMLLIILTVVITVVATFIVTAPIADEI